MNIRRHLFLMYKESLHNAVQHAGASKIKIDVDYTSGILAVRISDNGTGFDMANARQGRGLRSLKGRARQIGAELAISSKPDSGTSVSFSVALTPRPARKRRMMRIRHAFPALH